MPAPDLWFSSSSASQRTNTGTWWILRSWTQSSAEALPKFWHICNNTGSPSQLNCLWDFFVNIVQKYKKHSRAICFEWGSQRQRRSQGGQRRSHNLAQLQLLALQFTSTAVTQHCIVSAAVWNRLCYKKPLIEISPPVLSDWAAPRWKLRITTAENGELRIGLLPARLNIKSCSLLKIENWAALC